MPDEIGSDQSDATLNVDVDGSVSEESTDETSEVKKVEIPEEEYESLVDFVSNVMQFTDELEDGTRIWNVNKIVESQGYDPKSLAKVGELKDEVTVQEPEKKEEIPVTTEVTDEVVETFKKDPKAFVASIIQQARQAAAEEVKPLKEESQKNRVQTMLDTVRNKYDDFDQHSQDIAKLARRMPIQSVEDLETLYFAVKGQKGSPPSQSRRQTGLSGTVQSTDKSKHEGVDPDDVIFQEMLDSGVKPGKTDTLQALLGTDRLAPME